MLYGRRQKAFGRVGTCLKRLWLVVLWNESTADSDRGRSGFKEERGIRSSNTTCGQERDVRERAAKLLEILWPKRPGRKYLDHVGACFVRREDLGWGHRTAKNRKLMISSEADDFRIEIWGNEKFCPGKHRLFRECKRRHGACSE